MSFTDDAGNEETLTSAATVAVEASPNEPPTGVLFLDGMAEVGQSLRLSVNGLYRLIWDGNGMTYASFSYHWIRSDGTTDSDIQNATGSSYTLTDADEGKTIWVRVSSPTTGLTQRP